MLNNVLLSCTNETYINIDMFDYLYIYISI